MRLLIICILQAICISLALGKQIDLSNRTDASGVYEIGFCARPSPASSKGWPGHAFVSFSHKDTHGNRSFISIGHTVSESIPQGAAAWSLFGSSVSGRLKEEIFTSVMQDCLLVIVNRDSYEEAYALTKSPLQKLGLTRGSEPVFQAYRLGSEDCVTWMLSVADLLKSKGLNVPSRAQVDTPMGYMRKLISTN